MTRSTPPIAIIGAGISALSTAWKLSEAGYRADIFAAEFSPNITSNRAAAFWFPYHIRHDERGIDWCRISYQYYRNFEATSETGVKMMPLLKMVPQLVEEDRSWLQFMPEGSVTVLEETSLPTYIAAGYSVQVPLIETQLFMPWLMETLKERGVAFYRQTIESIDNLNNDYAVVINCSGLGSRTLCSDNELIPVRGQVALMEPVQGYPIYLENERALYVVPRQDATIVGGTYEMGVEDAVTQPADLDQILRKARAALPGIAHLNVMGSWAGLRPYRESVRLEQEPGKNIIHNYGHGGSGFTLAFGCGAEAAARAISLLH